MKINSDFHTHTKYSDGKGTVLENVEAAEKLKLRQIAITDHGFNHKVNGVLKRDFPLLQRDIEQKRKNSNISILLGIEANLISRQGDIDVAQKEEEKLDVLLVGFHVFAKAKNLRERFKFFIPNIFSQIFKYSKKRIEINTNAYINAIKKNNIDVVTHLGRGMQVDAVKIAQACKENNTYLELNEKNIKYFENFDIKKVLSTGVDFIINTDSHSPDLVGKPFKAIRFAEKHNIPEDRIVNTGEWQGISFKNHNKT